METTVKGSERLTKARRARRQKLPRKKLFCATPEDVAVTVDTSLLQLLIDFLEGKDQNGFPLTPDDLAPSPPDELKERLERIPDPCPFVALAILAPLLDRIERGWDDRSTFRDPWRTQLAEQMGERLGDEFAREEMKLAEERKAELSGNLRLAPRRDFGMTRQISIDMGVNDAVGALLPSPPARPSIALRRSKSCAPTGKDRDNK